MGLASSKQLFPKRKVDEATSNTSLSSLRFVLASDKPKWNVFWKRRLPPIQTFSATSRKQMKGCVCGNDTPCKQKITPKGVIMHYPKKKRNLGNFGRKKQFPASHLDKHLYGIKQCYPPKIDFITHKKYPTWKLDKI